ncbi:histidine phosphatase family protein [Pseudohalocynthiibacter sp. F2068]|jgi:alpha-ribazole phosphatase|uniref:histidine phosphatase family protein n=1 Tax=Pseudohalocynthiibacter sp. F2068 TaxID=2926418 RepID=UPI001FF4C055|nr:histidine phosphatase family protein [Pseudohalocynthiibacter sp. F2068]MCK0102491.1 histidine phosphatase family protein [Pseudohalocynthiibacter sp. F2068]
MTTWWWVRHGPTHRKDMIGWTDAPADLSDVYRLRRLHEFLPAQAPVVSSDLSRASDTASAIQGQRARLPHVRALREINFGSWEARHFDEIDSEEDSLIRQFWEMPGDLAAPDGESWNELSSRVSAFVDTHDAPAHIIAVAHMGTILTQVQRALGLSAYETLAQKIENFSVTALTHDNGVWHARHINHHP